MKIAITTDHTGFELLRQLEAYLVSQGHSCVDYGPTELKPADDYPDFIFPAAKAVANGECEVGIIMGGSGQGEAMAANRIKGVRCAVYYGAVQAPAAIDVEGNPAQDQYEILRLSRQHNHANMLSLAARFLSLDEAKQAADIWLHTSFSSEERHQRRIAKLDLSDDGAQQQPGSSSKTSAKELSAAHAQNAAVANDGTLHVRH